MSDRNGLISIDFSEVCAILSKAGIVMMGVGLASGPGRESIAARQAMADLMSGNMDMNDARTILINFTSTGSLKLKEVAEVMKYVKVATRNAMMVCGASVDESMDKELCVTVFAIGLCVPLESNPVIQIRTDKAKNNF